jgi:hypothetical protein
MIVFATPDWGGAYVAYFLLFVGGAVILLATLVGVVFGLKLLKKGPTARRRVWGRTLLLASLAFPVVCFLAPAQIFRIEYGSYPLEAYPGEKIKEGMTPEAVEAILGAPHKRSERGDYKEWFYYLDSFRMYYFGVNFGPDGRVIGTHGN